MGLFIITGSATLYTQDSNGTMLTAHILDPGGQIIASKRFDDDDDPATPNEWQDQYFFYHYDIRGSVTAMLDPNGEPVKQYTYDEFGNLEESGDAGFLNEVTFTGSVSDTSSGLQYLNARYYNPETGRFISQDSYTCNAYDPWTQNLYAYCGNNPVNFVDPTGHTPKPPGMPSSIYEQYEEYQEEQRIKKALSKLQNLIDSGLYDQIDQGDYKDVSLTGNTPNRNLAKHGCGYFAAIIAASISGADVDVYEAYKQFNNPKYDFINGSISPVAVSGYLMDKGFYPTSANWHDSPRQNSVYISAYYWETLNNNGVKESNWHYLCIATNSNGEVFGYNPYKKTAPYPSFYDLFEANNAVLIVSFVMYEPY